MSKSLRDRIVGTAKIAGRLIINVLTALLVGYGWVATCKACRVMPIDDCTYWVLVTVLGLPTLYWIFWFLRKAHRETYKS